MDVQKELDAEVELDRAVDAIGRAIASFDADVRRRALMRALSRVVRQDSALSANGASATHSHEDGAVIAERAIGARNERSVAGRGVRPRLEQEAWETEPRNARGDALGGVEENAQGADRRAIDGGLPKHRQEGEGEHAVASRLAQEARVCREHRPRRVGGYRLAAPQKDLSPLSRALIRREPPIQNLAGLDGRNGTTRARPDQSKPTRPEVRFPMLRTIS